MTAKYQEILQDILDDIEQGRFKRGQKLPSIRSLSQIYGCSKDTVQKAMLELKYRHKIYAVEKSGYYILEDRTATEEVPLLEPQDIQQLPYADFRLCLNESLVGRETYLYNYYHQEEGLEDLLISLGRLLASYDVYSKKEQLVITSGSQQALYILSQMAFPNKGQHILLESPTYHRMQELLDQQNLTYETIDRDLQGIDLKELEKRFASGRISCFYTIPRLHNPLGTSYSLETKKEIVRLADLYNIYLIEDDYLADFDSERQVPLHYLDTEDRVIYLKSFTPTLFPALRIGGVVLPHQLREPFLHYKRLIDYDTNLIMQQALALYIDNGLFARNTHALRENYLGNLKKMEKLSNQLDFPYTYQSQAEGVLLQLPHHYLSPRLKHAKLPLTWYQNEDWLFCRLAYDENITENLKALQTLLVKK